MYAYRVDAIWMLFSQKMFGNPTDREDSMALLKNHIPIILFTLIIGFFTIAYGQFYTVLHLASPDFEWITNEINARELRWRMLWGLSMLSLIVIMTISIVCSCIIIYHHPHGFDGRLITFIFVLLISIFILYVLSKQDLGGGASNAIVLHYSLATGIPVNNITESLMKLGSVAVILVLASSCCLLLKPKIFSVEALTTKYQLFHLSILSSTIFILIGVLQTYFLFRMSTAYLPVKDAHTITTTLTLSGSTAYTVFMLVIYGPVIFTLRSWSWSLAKNNLSLEYDVIKIKYWMAQKGFSNSTRSISWDLFLSFSPALLGVIINIMS